MIPDTALPIWTFRPNWADGVKESLSWLTDVLRSGIGAEQRRRLRRTPRRQIEFDLIAKDEARTFLTLALDRLGAGEWLFPLWIDCHRLPATLASGATRIEFPTTFREFEVGYALLLGDTFTFERVEIISVDADGIDLADGTAYAWPEGTRLYPLRRGRLDPDQSVTRDLQRLGTATLRYTITKPNRRLLGPDGSIIYRGDPVLEKWPDEREALDYAYERITSERDNAFGIPLVADHTGRAFRAETYNWLLPNREAQAAWRDMMYRLSGRLEQRWIPSFAQDLRLDAVAAGGQNYIDVKKAGLAYLGVPFNGRRDIMIDSPTGPVLRRVTGLGVSGNPKRERLVLDAPLVGGLDPASTKRISFLDTGRLDQDTVEVTHLTDGVATCRAAWRTLNPARTAPTPISFPIPPTAMSDTGCGVPEGGDPCGPPVIAGFDGWWLKFKVDFWPSVCGPDTFPNTFLDIHEGTTTDSPLIALSPAADHPGDGTPLNARQLEFFSGDHPIQYLEYTLWQSDNYWSLFPYDPMLTPRLYMLRIQFPPAVFNCTFSRYMRVSVRHWDQDSYTVIPCAWGNTVPLFDGTDADVEGIWPRDYGYIF